MVVRLYLIRVCIVHIDRRIFYFISHVCVYNKIRIKQAIIFTRCECEPESVLCIYMCWTMGEMVRMERTFSVKRHTNEIQTSQRENIKLCALCMGSGLCMLAWTSFQKRKRNLVQKERSFVRLPSKEQRSSEQSGGFWSIEQQNNFCRMIYCLLPSVAHSSLIDWFIYSSDRKLAPLDMPEMRSFVWSRIMFPW